MKRTLIVLQMLFVMLALSSCQGVSGIKGTFADLKDRISGGETMTYQKVAMETLPEVSQDAIGAVELAKRRMLQSSLYVKAQPQALKLENTTNYREFMRRNTIIMDFSSQPDGTYVQDMISESVDQIGRIDVSHERISYVQRKPLEGEIAAIAESILNISRGIQYDDKVSQERFKKSVADFQRSQGLTADGAMGMKTAQAMARESSVLDVKEMTSRIVLPEKPRTIVYAVPYEVVKQNPAAFSKGFESMEAVKKQALTQEQFQKIDQPGQQFTVFVYFLDRVDPGKDVRLALASSEHRWSEVITPIMYAPEEWPVLVESFRIDEKLGDARLYANVFQKAKFAYTCIGSHQLK